jgi:hypothetical protein
MLHMANDLNNASIRAANSDVDYNSKGQVSLGGSMTRQVRSIPHSTARSNDLCSREKSNDEWIFIARMSSMHHMTQILLRQSRHHISAE